MQRYKMPNHPMNHNQLRQQEVPRTIENITTQSELESQPSKEEEAQDEKNENESEESSPEEKTLEKKRMKKM
jgi:hypothetical protein